MDESKYYEFIDLYKNPEHFGKPARFDLSEEGYSQSCGDKFAVYIEMDGGNIRDAFFEGSGCIISTVSLSKLCGAMIGKPVAEVEKMQLADVKKLIGVDQISLSRIPCAMIGLETVKKALKSRTSVQNT